MTNDPAEAARAPVVGDAVVGCARAAVADAARTSTKSDDQAGPNQVPGIRSRQKSDPSDADHRRVRLQDTRRGDAAADRGLVEESLSSLATNQKLIPRDEPGGFFCSGNGILGSALPMAVGVKLAQSDRPVVCLLGDGATQYSVQGFWTAAREQLPVVFIVMDNREYAILKAFGKYLKTDGVPGLDLGGIDFAGLAAGYGLPYRGVEQPDDLAEALRAAFAADGPSLVHVQIDPKVPPLLG